MAIIYSYPETLELLPTDLLIGTSTIKVAGKKKNITKNFTLESLKEFILQGYATVAWGDITGVLSNQTDLQAALDSKQNNITLTTTGSTGPATLIGATLNIPDYSTGITVPTLNQVLTAGNESLLDAKIGVLYGYDTINTDYGTLEFYDSGVIIKAATTNHFLFYNDDTGTVKFSNGNYTPTLNFYGVGNNIYTFQNANGTLAFLSDIPAQISLTTTGTSGPSTLIGSTLNIPDYSAGISGTIPHTTASGTDAYTATVSGVTSYSDGNAYLVRFTNGNTTGCTLDINGLGAVPLYRNNDGQLIGGDIWAGAEMLCVYNSIANTFQCIGTSPNSLFAYVTNAESVAITKGQPVYAFGGTGDRLTVKLAYNTSDATSAQTVGVVVTSSIAANQKGIIIIQGLLDGLNIFPTSTWADGDPIYLGPTAGSITKTKQYAPNHLVYLGVVTSASNGSAGRWYVRVQNGYELDELHNVQAQSPSINDILYYFGGSPGQWKTASIPTVLGYTPFQLPSLTSGSVLFSNGTTITQNNSNFFWDNTNNRLGIGTSSPTGRLAIKTPGALSTDIALRVRNNADIGDLLTVNGLGGLNITSSTSGGDKPISVSTSTGEVFYIRGFGDAIFSGNVWLGVVNGTNRIGPGSMIITSSQGTGTAFATFTHNNSNIALRILSNSVIQLNPTAGNVLVGTTTDVASSKLTVESTTQGFLPPRMTTAQKNAIASPAAGLIVYDTTTNKACCYNGTTWNDLF